MLRIAILDIKVTPIRKTATDLGHRSYFQMKNGYRFWAWELLPNGKMKLVCCIRVTKKILSKSL